MTHTKSVLTICFLLLSASVACRPSQTPDVNSAEFEVNEGAGHRLDGVEPGHDGEIRQTPESSEEALDVGEVQARCGAIINNDLTSNRYSGLPSGMVQATLFYDGQEDAERSPVLSLELVEPESGLTRWVQIGSSSDDFGRIRNFSHIETREISLGACRLTGRVHIEGVVGNGVIDGLAFGLYGKYDDGSYLMLKSKSPEITTTANYVSAWPLGLHDGWFEERTPQLTDGHGRQAARMMIYGAQLMQNGMYRFQVR